ncbi:hypothetical protein [Chryseobacterium sp. RLHN22]|uniref:hypothetical protein n=1 Tax=Chryseobacterium sp. RLHN22 TaxID=3437885 RepID=UPI003D9AF777
MNFKLIIPLIFIISCSKKIENAPDKNFYQNWENLEIKTDRQTITVFKLSDSMEYENIIYTKEFYDIPPQYKIKKVQKYKMHVTNAEKDSLAKYIYASVTDPKFINNLATDYVGNVKLKFSKENMNLVCEYKSVGNWTEVSENTRKIYKLIKAKGEISTQ